MDEYLNNRQNESLWNLLANPADNGSSYAHNLQNLVNEYPQSGLLQVMLARANGAGNIGHGAVYLDPKVLYVVVNSPESLKDVTGSQIIRQGRATIAAESLEAESEVATAEEEPQDLKEAPQEEAHFTIEPEIDIEEQPNEPSQVIDEHAAAETESETEQLIPEERAAIDDFDEPIDEIAESPHVVVGEDEKAEVGSIETGEEETALADGNHPENIEAAEPIVITEENAGFYEDELVTEAGSDKQDVEPLAEEDELIYDEEIVKENVIERDTDFSKGIEDDIFDEIVGIEDIGFKANEKPVEEAKATEEPEQVHADTAPSETEETPADVEDETDRLITSNIISSDFFVFENAVAENKQEDAAAETAPVIAAEKTNEPQPDPYKSDVSRYHDDKMPYTFMWWLDKTRREHAGIYQPFKLDTTQAIKHQAQDMLQQQYYENIFHVSSIDELEKTAPKQTIEFDLKRKEDQIIKRFITEEPQIGTPSSDKLDNENKAKKSAVDQDELVTETLARIYADQMIYHKAINTYKKLILKFPEKSRYFADQIELLERKIN